MAIDDDISVDVTGKAIKYVGTAPGGGYTVSELHEFLSNNDAFADPGPDGLDELEAVVTGREAQDVYDDAVAKLVFSGGAREAIENDVLTPASLIMSQEEFKMLNAFSVGGVEARDDEDDG